jgi:hypothetical protein
MRDGVCQHNEDPGYPLTNRNCKSVAEVNELMQCNERLAVYEMAEEVEFPIVHVLGMRCVSTRFVP